MVLVTADLMRGAHQSIPAAFRDMPQFVSEPLSERIGSPVVVKAETANPIGCFKGRGTWLAVADLARRGEVGERQDVIVAEALELMLGVVDEMLLVDEEAILDATDELSAVLPFSIEPAAGARWAAIRHAAPHAGAISLVLTGGNVAL